jgi:hypothetical protein
MIKTHASLFSGIGGAEIAASWMGWDNVFHCEIQEFPRRVLEYWYPNSKIYEDITKTDFTEWRGKIDVLTGGFPCQPFSLAGQRRGADDDRYLWPETLRAIREIQPTWFVGENVAGLLTMVQPGEEIAVGRTDDIFEENHIYRKEQRFTLVKSARVLSVKDMPSSRLLFRLVPSERPTAGTGYGLLQEGYKTLLPTVQTQGLKRCNANGNTEFMPLDLLPTPCAQDGKNTTLPPSQSKRSSLIGRVIRKDLLPTPMVTDIHHARRVSELKEAGGTMFHSRANGETRPNGLLMTPNARDWKGAQGRAYKEGKMDLPMQVCRQTDGRISQLNPLFVQDMMGFPSDWLVSPFQGGAPKR